ncbi:M20/M25/M40 family metallo-hydrolase [Novilysobacter arseniciresistens]|uniref:M20/M25/M40 family metallo-hydrolase n=1 Tax=Novilysobacter arseniciresistens TaxID=1385522 RepID=UPI00068B5A93|nr:M20/M25/M40 family metallo-hydrolase [Lysobacter arseniciresistens]
MKRPILAAAIAAALVLPATATAAGGDPHTHVDDRLARAIAHDPQAPVYIVSSHDTYRGGLYRLASDASSVRDSTGAGLVVSEVRAHQLPDISRHIHDQERRCGGYFAFASRAEAERFLADELSAQAVTTTFADYTIDNQATVGPWLPQVAEANIRDTIDHLSSAYSNRHYSTASGRQAAQWIHDTWAGLVAGRDDASVELYNCGNCGGQPSVILTIEGGELPDEIVVLGGHLDSVSNAGSGESMLAPGADDDASGIATLTEVLRVAMADGWQPRRRVKFMGYAAEEVGLRGSNAIAQSFRDQGRNVVGVLQLDMTNHTAGASVDMQLISDYSNGDLQQFVRDVFDEYLAPLGLTRGSYTCGYGCSDHASWTSAGYPSAMMFEASFNNDIHTRYDTLSNMGGTANGSVPLAKLGLAFLGELAKTAGGGGEEPPPPPGDELEKGVPVTGLSASTGDDVTYTFEVPDGAANLSFAISGGSGDADLYVRRGSAPTDSSYDCRPWRSGNAETCSFAAPAADTWHVRVKAYSSFSNVSLVADYTTGGGGGTQTYANDADYPIRDRSTVESPISVSGRGGNAPASARVEVDIRHSYRGDLRVDLVAPDGSSYNLHNRSGGSADDVIGNFDLDLSGEPLDGSWKLRVHDAYYGDTGYINRWSITF